MLKLTSSINLSDNSTYKESWIGCLRVEEIWKRKSLVFLSAAAALTLAACGSANNNSNTSLRSIKSFFKIKFNSEVTHEGTAIKGGTLKYALVAASPFSGIFIDELASNSTDSTIASQSGSINVRIRMKTVN